MTYLKNLYSWKHPHLTESPVFLAGMECEIESLASQTIDTTQWGLTEDGSLRNHGLEFVSVPLERETLVKAFKNLHANLMFLDKTQAFSPRTSTHVHVNCRSFTTTQLKTMLLLYALFEDFFFSMVKPERRNNIHCVPLTETYLQSQYNKDITHLVSGWHKYTAFNLCPIGSQGTVEFRHMHGTDDAVLMAQWLETIENLWKLSQQMTITVENITNNRYHEEWFHSIFANAPQVLALKPSLHNVIENSLLDVKFALI